MGEEPIFGLISFHLVRALLVHVKRKKKGRKGRRRKLGFEIFKKIKVRKFFNLLSCLLGSYPNSFFGNVCVRKNKTLTLLYLGFVSLNRVLRLALNLFWFGVEFVR